MERVKSIIFNWHQTGSSSESQGAGEDYSIFEVGKNNVISIEESRPTRDDSTWNYLITLKDGSSTRIFNPNVVEYTSEW